MDFLSRFFFVTSRTEALHIRNWGLKLISSPLFHIHSTYNGKCIWKIWMSKIFTELVMFNSACTKALIFDVKPYLPLFASLLERGGEKKMGEYLCLWICPVLNHIEQFDPKN